MSHFINKLRMSLVLGMPWLFAARSQAQEDGLRRDTTPESSAGGNCRTLDGHLEGGCAACSIPSRVGGLSVSVAHLQPHSSPRAGGDEPDPADPPRLAAAKLKRLRKRSHRAVGGAA